MKDWRERLAEIRAEAARRVPEWRPEMTAAVGYAGAGTYCWSHERWESIESGCANQEPMMTRKRWAAVGWWALIVAGLALGPGGLFAAQILAHYGVIGG